MSQCPFAAPGRQEACLALMKQREEAMTREYDVNECYSCPQRRKRLEEAKPPQRINIPPADFRGAGKPVPVAPAVPPPTEKKETPVATDKKDQVFRQIERTKSCTQSRITQYMHIKPNELAIIAAELEKEGRIRVWPKGGRNMYTLPDQPDPWPGKRYATRKPAEKKVEAKTATPRVARASGPAAKAPSSPTGPFASEISSLLAKKKALMEDVAACDRAILALRYSA